MLSVYNVAQGLLRQSGLGMLEIPAYGLVQLSGISATGTGAQTNRDGQAIWSARNPDGLIQDPWMLAVNGHSPIPKSGYGIVRQDWPQPVLWGESDSVTQYGLCGPKRATSLADEGPYSPDCFKVWKSGSAFRVVSRDVVVTPDGATVVWIVPATPATGAVSGTLADSGAGITAGSPLSVKAITGGLSDGGEYPNSSGSAVVTGPAGQFPLSDLASGYGIRIDLDGIYSFGFTCNLMSSTATLGGIIGLRVCVGHSDLAAVPNTTTTGTAPDYLGDTLWYAWRKQAIIYDTYGNELLRTAENVSLSGAMRLYAGQVFCVRNDSLYTVNVANFTCWLCYQGPLTGMPHALYTYNNWYAPSPFINGTV